MADSVKQKNRVRSAKAVHEQKTQERTSEHNLLKAAYLKDKESVAFQDILAKAKSFASYHTKIAQDGVGARKTGYTLENGQPEVETVYHTNEKRVSELDRAAGLLELVDYIERMTKVPESSVVVDTDVEKDVEAEEE